MINTIPFSPSPYPPRAIVQVNGVNVQYLSARIETTDFFTADNFSVALPLNGQPTPITLNYLSASPQFEVNIYAGYPQNSEQFTVNDLTLILSGEADDFSVDPANGLIKLEGRDLSGRLLDKKTTRKFSNYTASQLAILLAQENGLNPIVTPTHQKLGAFYILDQTLSVRERTEWDLLVGAAQAEGFVTYIEAGNLIFKPFPTDTTNPFVIYYQERNAQTPYPIANAEHLTFSRDLTLAQDVEVKIRVPFNTQTGQAFTVTAESHNTSKEKIQGLPLANGKKQVYSLIRSGFTKEQALQYAQTVLRNITLHSVKMFATLPGDVNFKKDTLVKVQGTNSDFDNIYYTSRVLRTIDKSGFRMTFEAKNNPPDSQLS